ncbi:ATPase [Rhodobacteraceae bacterium]|nr:ATPase [Paracoccaceae bacterium]
MIYKTKSDWLNAPDKRIMLFGMSGLGKTHVSNMLRATGNWFHYSVDYRIGTRYMGEYISDNLKREAMRSPLLRDLLMTDSVQVKSNITFNDLSPLSTYLGKPGDPAKGGVPWDEYLRRQRQHRAAEQAAMRDTAQFAARAHDIYGYDNFVCDTSGSICEIVDPEDENDPVLSALSDSVLMIWIEGSEDHADELARRFDKAPKPMCYQNDFLQTAWSDYLTETNNAPEAVDPDAFVRWTYRRALAHRQPRYRAMADNWGLTLKADDMAGMTSESELVEVIGAALG